MITHISRDDLPLLDRAAHRFRGVLADAAFLEPRSVMTFVASEGDDILGWCWGYRLVRPDGSAMLYVHGLDVAEAHRRRGIGRNLLAAFMAAGREAGASTMFVFTDEANAVARSFYESMGGGPPAQGPSVNYWFRLDS
ncbi:GNAT family N-acetyltransferase [Streptomyces sp. NBC_01423]|uniref:GNAT family N-acetyltransferase n=1 Tax=Streptomyces sp. NBC_01423 TaxID=2903860 RepID=UPI002E2B3361|nr:GNAT family N-acetyltransferase [Streptomyces sp. NBC_01423]